MKEFEKAKVMKDRVMIYPSPIEDKVSASGIVVPAHLTKEAKTGEKWGVVVKVGEEVKSLSVGDKVLLGGFSVSIIDLDEKTYYICGEDSVLVIIPKE